MNTAIVGPIAITLLLLGTGYTARTIFLTIERVTLTRIQKGLSSSEAFAQQLTGMRLDSSERLVPINKNPKSK